MALSTIYTFLMHKASSSSEYTKLMDITGAPALRPAPEMIDVSDLSHDTHLYIPGMKDTNDRAFSANYDPTVFNTLKGMEGSVHDFAVWLGGTPNASGGTVTPTGDKGKFEFSGYPVISKDEAEVGGAQTMTLTIATQTEDTFSVPTTP